MMKTKALTQVPLGAIKNFIEKNFTEIEFSEQASIFFENEFLGDVKDLELLIELKDGSPDEVSKWLLEKFNVNLELNGDYAIASVLAMLLNFTNKAIFSVIEGHDKKEYGGGLHKRCKHTKIKHKNGTYVSAYLLDVKNAGYEVLISEDELDNNLLNDNSLLNKNIMRTDQCVNLTLPMVKFKEETDFSPVFIGSKMTNKKTLIDYKVDEVKTVLLMDLGLDKVEIKQVAAMTLCISGCASFDPTINYTIKDDFYIYVRFENKLLFASRMLKEDFIQGAALEKFKASEEKAQLEMMKN